MSPCARLPHDRHITHRVASTTGSTHNHRGNATILTHRTLINRRAAAILAATLTVGATGSAAARPFNINSAGSFVPAGTTTAPLRDPNMGGHPGTAPAGGQLSTGSASTHRTGVSSAEYVVIGAGGATVALIGVGALGMATRRRHRPAGTAQPTIAA